MFKSIQTVSAPQNVSTDENLWRKNTFLLRALNEFKGRDKNVYDVLSRYQAVLAQLEHLNQSPSLTPQRPTADDHSPYVALSPATCSRDPDRVLNAKYDGHQELNFKKTLDDFTAQFCLFIQRSRLENIGECYFIELRDRDFNYVGMRVMLEALVTSIPMRDKPVSLIISPSQNTTEMMDITLGALSTIKSSYTSWNISEISLLGQVLPRQLLELMQLISGTSIKVLRLNALSNVNKEHIKALATGLNEDCLLLCKIELNDWPKEGHHNMLDFSVEFRFFLDKVALYCKNLLCLRFRSNAFVRSEEPGIAFALNTFSKKLPACRVVMSEPEVFKEQSVVQPPSLTHSSARHSVIKLTMRHESALFGYSVKKRPTINQENSANKPWIQQQKGCDMQRMEFERWFRTKRISPVQRMAACSDEPKSVLPEGEGGRPRCGSDASSDTSFVGGVSSTTKTW